MERVLPHIQWDVADIAILYGQKGLMNVVVLLQGYG